MLIPEYVVNEFLGRNPPDQSVAKTAGVVLELTRSVNPIDEIMLSSKLLNLLTYLNKTNLENI